jgi:hypothetical protein
MEFLGSKLDFQIICPSEILGTPPKCWLQFDIPNLARHSWPSSMRIDSQHIKHVGMNVNLALMNRLDVTKQKLEASLNERPWG